MSTGETKTADRMKIKNQDGQDRYLVDEHNEVKDLRHCACERSDPDENQVCQACDLPILGEHE